MCRIAGGCLPAFRQVQVRVPNMPEDIEETQEEGSGIIQFILGIVRAVVSAIRSVVTGAVDAVRGVIASLMEWLVNAISSLAQQVITRIATDV